MFKRIFGIILAISVISTTVGCATGVTQPERPAATSDAWKKKDNLLPDVPRDPKVDEFIQGVPDMDNRYLILDRCYTKGELASTMQIARIQVPHESREVHMSSMLWVLNELQFPEEVVELYIETFNFVWDTFSMEEKPGYVHWVTHNECIKAARTAGELEPLTTEQQKELDEIESRYHHLTGGTGDIGGFKWLPATVRSGAIKNYCGVFADHVKTILPLKRVGISPERIYSSVDTTEMDSKTMEEYLAHWAKVIEWTYANDYEYAHQYWLNAKLECLNNFDEDAPI